MSKTPDDDLFCEKCQSVNVRPEPDGGHNAYRCVICKTLFYPDLPTELDEEYNELTKFGGGATRSSDADSERYDLIPPIATKREAIRMAQGARTHGERNWEQADPIRPFQDTCLNHLERHLVAYKLGDRTDDHLAAIRCNAAFLIHFEEIDNDRIADSELVGFNYPKYSRYATIHSRGEAHLDGSLPSTSKKR